MTYIYTEGASTNSTFGQKAHLAPIAQKAHSAQIAQSAILALLARIAKSAQKPYNTIARLSATTWSWSIAGRLNAFRSDHGVILVNSKLVVVGGRDNKPTKAEFCQWENEEFTCIGGKQSFLNRNVS